MTIKFSTVPTPHIRIIRQYDRPTMDIPWWTTIIPDTVTEYYNTAYINQGKLTEEWAESDDGLSLYHNSLYLSVAQTDFENWSTDPTVQSWMKTRKEYCDSVGIIIHPSEGYLVVEGHETPNILP